MVPDLGDPVPGDPFSHLKIIISEGDGFGIDSFQENENRSLDPAGPP